MTPANLIFIQIQGGISSTIGKVQIDSAGPVPPSAYTTAVNGLKSKIFGVITIGIDIPSLHETANKSDNKKYHKKYEANDKLKKYELY